MTTVGFLHTSPVHVATFDALLTQVDRQARAVHVVDEGLLDVARRHGPASVVDRVRDALAGLSARGAQTLCCTCSTIGDVAEGAAGEVPVVRVDRPMAARAVRAGRRVAVVAALDSTLVPTRTLLEQEARAARRAVDIELVVASGAWSFFEAGDQVGYLASVAQTVREIAPGADVVVLAQASMADAEAVLTDLPQPVLSSPRSAVEHLLAVS